MDVQPLGGDADQYGRSKIPCRLWYFINKLSVKSSNLLPNQVR